MEQTTRDALNRLAAAQLGLVTRAQLLSYSVSRDTIRWRLASKRWVAVHPGVYLTSPGRRDWPMLAMAAVLHGGPEAVLWADSAAFSHGLAREPDVIQVLVPHSSQVSGRPGVTVSRARDLAERAALEVIDEDAPDLARLPRTTVEATVLDVGARLDADGVLALVASACQKGLTWDEALRVELSRRSRYRWRDLLEAALVDVGDGAQSVLELRYLRDVERAHALPSGVSQQPTAGGWRHHDRGYPDQRVLVELQGLAFHGTAAAQVRDGRRQRDSLQEGWVTVPAFWSDVAGSPCALAGEVGALLSRRGWSGRVRRCRRRGCGAATPQRVAPVGS
ncbi:type IV toxin-antitoxin system AbiEi family antitoxin domain-containing protein [Lapillicoccus jejuensis]|uniref:Uncharacterized protein n=1 Tax=Lapillicoccus jejuensis TaxID=402171 RepID=A0A542E3N4_9MICO|nr:type IV toxin-antitoxin system AbiEi family antitoxin domain-containing protein [Lapillicoccus jejuensis]TQJ09909.1 hypothetical protein FB458_3025 [Lapillicoccus jejuensis]